MVSSDFTIGHKVMLDRHWQGHERSAFAKKCYLTPDSLKRIELGTRKVRPHELYEIAKQLGRTMEHFLEKPVLVERS